MMMLNGLTAWELADLLTCRCRSRRCITCHISVLHNSPLDHPLALLLPTLSLSLHVGHNPCIYNLYSQPRSQSRSHYEPEKISPGPGSCLCLTLKYCLWDENIF